MVITDRMLEIIDDLFMTRNDCVRTARRLSISVEEAQAALDACRFHGRAVFMVRSDWTSRGARAPVRPLDDEEARRLPLA